MFLSGFVVFVGLVYVFVGFLFYLCVGFCNFLGGCL